MVGGACAGVARRAWRASGHAPARAARSRAVKLQKRVAQLADRPQSRGHAAHLAGGWACGAGRAAAARSPAAAARAPASKGVCVGGWGGGGGGAGSSSRQPGRAAAAHLVGVVGLAGVAVHLAGDGVGVHGRRVVVVVRVVEHARVHRHHPARVRGVHVLVRHHRRGRGVREARDQQLLGVDDVALAAVRQQLLAHAHDRVARGAELPPQPRRVVAGRALAKDLKSSGGGRRVGACDATARAGACDAMGRTGWGSRPAAGGPRARRLPRYGMGQAAPGARRPRAAQMGSAARTRVPQPGTASVNRAGQLAPGAGAAPAARPAIVAAGASAQGRPGVAHLLEQRPQLRHAQVLQLPARARRGGAGVRHGRGVAGAGAPRRARGEHAGGSTGWSPRACPRPPPRGALTWGRGRRRRSRRTACPPWRKASCPPWLRGSRPLGDRGARVCRGRWRLAKVRVGITAVAAGGRIAGRCSREPGPVLSRSAAWACVRSAGGFCELPMRSGAAETATLAAYSARAPRPSRC
jgi:hypothetical protein